MALELTQEGVSGRLSQKAGRNCATAGARRLRSGVFEGVWVQRAAEGVTVVRLGGGGAWCCEGEDVSGKGAGGCGLV